MYHIPAIGIEVYLQTTFGSPAFNSGTQPSMSLLFDQSLPLGIGFELWPSKPSMNRGSFALPSIASSAAVTPPHPSCTMTTISAVRRW